MREKELRLALVCYGGVSLAVYMHGITGEIWRLAQASRAFHDGDEPPAGTPSLYGALLKEIEEVTGTRLRVLVDIIAGASAGGINGIFLAQAIASGQSLDPLTTMWLENADIEALLDPDAAPARFSKLWATPLAWLAAGRNAIAETVEPATREEVGRKLQQFVRARWFEPPFGGKRLSHMILDALDAMAAGHVGPRLLPEGQPLDLYVTVTDFRGHPERLRLNSPPEVLETEHRLVFPFSDHGDGRLGDRIGLAFAARATSSFPGAFPPLTPNEFDQVVAERGIRWRARNPFLNRMLPRHAAAKAVDRAVLIDGSVLANAPFRPAMDALRDRPAKRQIDRRFVYIDPVPGQHFSLGVTGGEAPGFFPTIIGALSELPRQQPIRDNLEAIEARTARIERLRDILGGIRHEVERMVTTVFGETLTVNELTAANLASWRRLAHQTAAEQAGFAYASYTRLKVIDVTSQLARLLTSVAGNLTHERGRRLHERIAQAVRDQVEGSADPTGREADAPVASFLRTLDLGFRIRRLRLLARRLSELEGQADEFELEPVRTVIYDRLADYLDLQRSDRFSELRPAARRARADGAALLTGLAAVMDLPGLDAATDAALSAAFARLRGERRQQLLLAYLGFPFFDVATLPLLQGEGLDEFDPVRIDRISPDDATTIRAGGAAATLKGMQFHKFGAFFSRAYRENDYLWGRLHGADRLIDIVVSTLPTGARLGAGRLTAI